MKQKDGGGREVVEMRDSVFLHSIEKLEERERERVRERARGREGDRRRQERGTECLGERGVI